MKAVTFFRVIQHGRKIYNRERNLMYADLSDVITAQHGKEAHKEVREHFMRRAFPRKSRALDAASPQSFAILESMTKSLNPALMGMPHGRH